MSASVSWRERLSAALLRAAAGLLRGRHPEWAAAVFAENEAVARDDRLGWAAGCLVASCRAAGADSLAYLGALAVGLAALAAYQWSADESLLTLVVIAALGLALGLFDPRRYLASGVAVGLVVAGVNAFETLTGLHPDYETARHGLVHDLRWTLLVPPGVLAAAAGRAAGLRLKS